METSFATKVKWGGMTYRKLAPPRGLGNGFGRTGGDYAVYRDGRRIGTIYGIDSRTWQVQLNGFRTKLCGSLAKAKTYAEQMTRP